jgi:hypothetical protein
VDALETVDQFEKKMSDIIHSWRWDYGGNRRYSAPYKIGQEVLDLMKFIRDKHQRPLVLHGCLELLRFEAWSHLSLNCFWENDRGHYQPTMNQLTARITYMAKIQTEQATLNCCTRLLWFPLRGKTKASKAGRQTIVRWTDVEFSKTTTRCYPSLFLNGKIFESLIFSSTKLIHHLKELDTESQFTYIAPSEKFFAYDFARV